jgi:hypothetical protein
MPLDKSGSKEAFSKNVAAEREAGKPEKQAVAIAYSVDREDQERREARAAHEYDKYGRSSSY